MTRAFGFFDEWAARKSGLPVEALTIRSLLGALRRRVDLRYAATGSPLGGRIDDHLERLTPKELDQLAQEGEQFLEDVRHDVNQPRADPQREELVTSSSDR